MIRFLTSKAIGYLATAFDKALRHLDFIVLIVISFAAADGLQAATYSTNTTDTISTSVTYKPGLGSSSDAFVVGSAGNLTINNGATVRADGADTTGDNLLNSGTITVDGATLTIATYAILASTDKVNFDNTGIINIKNGSNLNIVNNRNSNGGYNRGTINIDATSAFNVSSNTSNSSKVAYTQTGGTLNLDGTLNNNIEGSSSIVFSGGTLSGNGTINGAIRITSGSVVLAPGGYSAIGTLTSSTAQIWNSGFTLNWQRNATASDLLEINGTLTLSSSAAYTVNLSTLGVAPLALGAAEWSLVTANSFTGLNLANWSISATQASFLGAAGYSSANLKLIQRGNSVVLALWDGSTFVYRENIQNNTWNSTSSSYANIWEGSPTRTTQAGDNVYFTARQASATTVTLSETATLGNLTIGNTSVSYTLAGSAITFNNNGALSLLTHAAGASTDTISSAINYVNDLEIRALTDTPLVLSGTLSTASGKNLTVSGGGNVTFAQSSTIDVANITISDAGTHLTLNNAVPLVNDATLLVEDGASLSVNNANVSNSGTMLVRDGATLRVTASGSGGGINNSANFTLSNATLVNNGTTGGAGIRNTANFTMLDAVFDNTATDAGGYGIHNSGGGVVTMNNTSLSNNVSGSGAIGIYNLGSSSQLVLENGSVLNQTLRGDNVTTAGLSNSGIVRLDASILHSNLNGFGSAILNSAGGEFFLQNGSVLNSNVTSGTGNAILNTGAGSTFNIDATSRANVSGTFASTANATLSNSGEITMLSGNLLVGNATLANYGTGVVQLEGVSDMLLQANARVLNDGEINGNIRIDGSNVLLAGSGTYNGTISDVRVRTTFSPGTMSLSGVSEIGKMNIIGDQSWLNGFAYNWQMGSVADTSIAANDWISIDGRLDITETDNGIYTLNLGWVGTLDASTLLNGKTWTLLTASDGIYGFDQLVWNWEIVATGLLSHLGVSTTGYFDIIQHDKSLLLIYLLLNDSFVWRQNTSGDVSDINNWEENDIPNIGSQVFFTNNQNSGTGNVDFKDATITMGTLTIGSANGTDSSYLLHNGTILLSNRSNTSTITHHENTKGNDEIGTDIIATDADIAIIVESRGDVDLGAMSVAWTNNTGQVGEVTDPILTTNVENYRLTISGNIDMNDNILYKTVGGTLVLSGVVSNAAHVSHEGGGLFVDGTLTANTLTVVGGAYFGGSGQVNANITLLDEAILRQGREGAAFNDRLSVIGNVNSGASMSIDLTASLSRIFSTEAGDRMSSAYTSGLDIDGLFTMSAGATYTVNLYNLTDFNVQDWSVYKNAREGAYYSLLSWTGGGTGADVTWKLKWGNGYAPNDLDNWSLVLKDDAQGRHTLWLYYATPVRIPEPGTYAVITGALALALAIIRRHRKRK